MPRRSIKHWEHNEEETILINFWKAGKLSHDDLAYLCKYFTGDDRPGTSNSLIRRIVNHIARTYRETGFNLSEDLDHELDNYLATILHILNERDRG